MKVGAVFAELAERMLAGVSTSVGIKCYNVTLATCVLITVVPAVLPLCRLIYQIKRFFIFRAWA
jgi:hypothetical protein